MKRKNTTTTTTAGEQLDFFGIIDNATSDNENTALTFAELFEEAEEDPTADADLYTDYFSVGDTAYHADFLNPAAGIVIKVDNTYNPGRKAAALITIQTEDGETIIDYQSNFTRTRPAILDFYQVQ